jgi:glycosyltransferase involved in cell wall biosynthesis
VADDWPYVRTIHEKYWRLPANRALVTALKQQAAKLPLWLLQRDEQSYPLRFEHVICVSQAVKKNLVSHLGLSPDRLQVVYNGIELDQFTASDENRESRTALRLLYAGNITVEKGVETAIEALHLLSQQPIEREIRLTLIGSGHPDYEAHLKHLVEKYQIGQQVQFRNRLPRQEMPEVFRQHDVLVFPSTGEALPRVVQEAMASGLAVVGTTAGGTGEILIEEETGLTFLPGDAAGLASQIERLSREQVLFDRLRNSGREFIQRRFDIRKTVDAIEVYLQQVALTGPVDTYSKIGLEHSQVEI